MTGNDSTKVKSEGDHPISQKDLLTKEGSKTAEGESSSPEKNTVSAKKLCETECDCC